MRDAVTRSLRFGWAVPIALAVVVALLPWLGADGVLQRNLMLAAMYGLLVAGFNLGFGYGGQLALGQVAVFAGGAYATAILYSHGVSELTVAALVSMAFAALLGLITGLPGLRFSSWALALVAFFLVVLIPHTAMIFESETGGVQGISGILEPHLFGAALSLEGLYVVTIGATAICLLLFRNLVRSRYGHGLLVLKQGTPLARSLGLSPFRLRLSAYVLGSLPAGLAGALYAYYSTYVQADAFAFNLVTMLLAASIIGGVTSIWAAPVAAAILVIGPEQTAAFEEYSVLAYGVVLMLTGVGLAGGLAGLATGLSARVAGRRAARAPSSAADVAPPSPSPAEEETATLAIAGERLTTSDVAKRFGGVDALKGVDFRAEPGKHHGDHRSQRRGEDDAAERDLRSRAGRSRRGPARRRGSSPRCARSRSRRPASHGRSRRPRSPSR